MSFSPFEIIMATKIFTMFIVLALTSCLNDASHSDNALKDIYIKETVEFCEVHSVEYWENSGQLEALNAMNASEKQIELIRVIHSTVKQPKLQGIVFTDNANTPPLKDYYPYLQAEIPKLTGKPFECPAIEAFYTGG